MVGAALFFSGAARAETQTSTVVVDESLRAKAVEGAPASASPWKVTLNVGATGSFNHSHQVVGAEQGATLQLGGVIGLAANWKSGQHAWENSLDLKHAQTKTPQFDRFIKSQDSLDLKSTYLYSLLNPKWAGAYGRFALNTQILPNDIVRAEDVVVTRDPAGTPSSRTVVAGRPIRLTGAFEPLILRETAGVFANPRESDEFTAKAKLGFGAQHILTRDGFALAAEDGTNLTLNPLETVNELGSELGLELAGLLIKDVATWKAAANFFLPLVTTSDTALSTTAQLNSEFSAAVSFKLAQWLSLDYTFLAKRVPLVLDAWQLQNGFLLTAGFQLL